ncbi:MAG: DUF4296 domain-containing protein [Bacteroidales bacterium]|jgi:hypothetical protein|nr:DUF4296 domain-containing protein [Bacteroidales bacterium]
MKRVIFVAFVVLFASCSKESSQADLPIKQDTMAVIVYQMQKAKAIVATVKDTTASQANRLSAFRQDIFQEHNVSEKSFDSCWTYYLSNPAQMDTLLNKVSKLVAKDL